jgi:hypothetical protein
MYAPRKATAAIRRIRIGGEIWEAIAHVIGSSGPMP